MPEVPAALRIDLNADVGEGYGAYSMGADESVLPFVTSANIACGFHAGDPAIMDRTVALARKLGIAAGAHPGYYDLRGFGRRALPADPKEIELDVLYQVGALSAFAAAHETRLVHVKPHGALYNQAAVRADLARAIARAVARFDSSLILVGSATSEPFREAASDFGLTFAAEAFADRRYEGDGTLTPRSLPGSLITDPAEAAAQALSIARDGLVVSRDGSSVALKAETLCLHGDTPGAPSIAAAVRAKLTSAGITLGPLRA